MSARRGDWLVTYSGVKFYPLDPVPEEILMADVAHGLSNICRFGGHTRVHYSVAEHSVRVAHLILRRGFPRIVAAWGLVHDAAESYLGDVIRPLKGFFPAYRAAEEKVIKAISEKLELSWPMPAAVKDADFTMMACEMRDLVKPPYGCATGHADSSVEAIVPVQPGGAEFMWRKEFRRFFLRSVEEIDGEL